MPLSLSVWHAYGKYAAADFNLALQQGLYSYTREIRRHPSTWMILGVGADQQHDGTEHESARAGR
jgi:hypothetical protein